MLVFRSHDVSEDDQDEDDEFDGTHWISDGDEDLKVKTLDDVVCRLPLGLVRVTPSWQQHECAQKRRTGCADAGARASTGQTGGDPRRVDV